MRLQYCRPGEMSTDIAVILLDSEENCVRIQFTTDWNRYNEDEVEILTALEQDIQNKTADLGATELFRHLLETLSNAILITEPESLTTTDPQLTLDELHDRFLGCSEAPKEAIGGVGRDVHAQIAFEQRGVERHIARHVRHLVTIDDGSDGGARLDGRHELERPRHGRRSGGEIGAAFEA